MVLLPYSDGFALPGQQHAFIGGRLSHLIGAVRQEVAAGAGMAIFVCGDGHNHVAHSVGLAAHHYGVGRTINHLKGNPRKGGIALWCAPHLAVLLFNVNAAPNYLVFNFVLQHLSVLRNGDGDFLRESLEHGVVGGNLPDGVFTVGQRVLASGCHTAGIGGDGHSYLPGLGSVAVHHHGVLGVVDNLKGNPL